MDTTNIVMLINDFLIKLTLEIRYVIHFHLNKKSDNYLSINNKYSMFFDINKR